MTSKPPKGLPPEAANVKHEVRALSPEMKASIARLVQRGGVKHANAGQYFHESTSAEYRKTFPIYDVKALVEAFPKVMEIGFDEVQDPTKESPSFFAVVRAVSTDSKSDVRIPLGSQPPVDTQALIEVIKGYFQSESRKMLKDLEAMKDLFDDFE